MRDSRCRHSGGGCKHQGFDETFTKQPPAAGPDSRPYLLFTLPSKRLAQRKARHVHAGDEQQHGHGTQQHEERLPCRWHEPRGAFLVDREMPRASDRHRLTQFFSDGVRNGPGRARSQCGVQPADAEEPVRRILPAPRMQVEGKPDRLILGEERRAWTEHADDGVAFVVQHEGRTERGGRSAKTCHPEFMREDGDLFAARCAVTIGEKPADVRPDAEHVEEAQRDDASRHPFRCDGLGQVERRADVGFEALEHCGLLLPAENLLGAQRASAELAGTGLVPDVHQALGMEERRRPQNELVDDAENSRSDTDRHRQREDCERGCSRFAGETPCGGPHVTTDVKR
jgi:hypothetical protein